MVTKAQKLAMQNTQTTEAPQTGSENAAAGTVTVLENRRETGDNARSRGVVTERKNIFTQVSSDTQKRLADKAVALSSAKQKLAMAADLYSEGDAKSDEARGVSAEAGFVLYQARSRGLVSNEEVSATLGDVFGFKTKKDGTASKTPDGQGEAIRKRVVRATALSEFVRSDGKEGGTFFEGLETTSARKEDGLTVSDLLDMIEQGEMSIYRAYDVIAEIKRDNADRLNAAFDPKRIAAIVEALSEEGAVQQFRDNPALVTAYAALRDVLTIIGEQAVIDEAA